MGSLDVVRFVVAAQVLDGFAEVVGSEGSAAFGFAFAAECGRHGDVSSGVSLDVGICLERCWVSVGGETASVSC